MFPCFRNPTKALGKQRSDIFLFRYLEGNHDDNTCPGKRIYLLVILGVLVSIIVMELSSDEYYVGQNSVLMHTDMNGSVIDSGVNSTGFDLSFYNLKCSVEVGEDSKEKMILNQVSGRINAGKLTTILGQSGSGKSTLIQKLLGRTKSFCAYESGDIFVNGQIEWNGLESLIDQVGYVPQHDVLYSELTVYETIMFSASWRLPKSYLKEDKENLVNRVIDILQLGDIRNKVIGNLVNPQSGYRILKNEGSKLSGGERKRISIAVELVSLPKVLLMDEPTSGLDSASALSLMRVLQDISRLGVTVVAIVHQPSERIFRLSDDVILMDRGEAAFIGPRESLNTFLTKVGYSHESTWTAETVLDVLAGLVKPAEQPLLDFEELFDEYQNSRQNMLVGNGEVLLDGFTAEDFKHCLMAVNDNSCYNSRTSRSHPRLPVIFRGLKRLEGKKTKLTPVNVSNAENAASWYKPITADLSVRPGFKSQFLLWVNMLLKLTLRKRVGFEVFSICILAIIVGFVSGYNRSWSRKPMNNVFLSLSLGLLGALGTVYSDDMDPVRRAADSGMILGAHELALLVNNLLKGWMVCHIFSFSFFLALYVKTNVFIIDDGKEDCDIRKYISWRKFHKYYQFAHINHLNYSVTSAAGTAICVFADHNPSLCNVLAIGFLISCHVFAAFSPNENQLRKDSKIFGIDFSKFFVALSRLSYVTYYLEAIFLWDQDEHNPRARRLTMRYYAYKEDNKTFTCHCMFGLWTFYQVLRFITFVMKNSNEFHSIHDTPYLAIFVFKVAGVHMVAWVLMSLVQDFYIPFVSAMSSSHLESE